mmetsp:Transcript_11730/g.21249  ORF Transcript_11730/g.21249 Transcript_11730/m.21249 type:complete len:88 (-) Transcript_11730:522-785(-)
MLLLKCVCYLQFFFDLKEMKPDQVDRHTKKEHPVKDHHEPKSGNRGLPKKDGAGGKGTWGGLMDSEGPAVLDSKDPNYEEKEPEIEK